jgi:Tol biopolymer transport system component
MNRNTKAARTLLGLAVVGAAVSFTACSDSTSKPNQTNPLPGAAAAATPTTGTADLIAFRRFTDATYTSSQIVTARLDGSQQNVLTTPGAQGADSIPTWSPDGARLAFGRSVPRPDCGAGCFEKEIYVVDAHGGQASRLTHAPGGALCTPQGPSACGGDPAWSPDGRQIAFNRTVATADDPQDQTGIWVVNADGSGERQLASQPAPQRIASPSWSPDGTRLAFERGRFDGDGQAVSSAVFTMRSDGTDERQVTPVSKFGDHPQWSPDGQTIMFRDNIGTPTNHFKPSALYTVHPDGSGLTRLTGSDPNLQYLSGSFSPDGKSIVVPRVHQGSHDDQAELYVLSNAGAVQRLVVENPDWQSMVRWSPRS